jgi:hypothetical protein
MMGSLAGFLQCRYTLGAWMRKSSFPQPRCSRPHQRAGTKSEKNTSRRVMSATIGLPPLRYRILGRLANSDHA